MLHPEQYRCGFGISLDFTTSEVFYLKQSTPHLEFDFQRLNICTVCMYEYVYIYMCMYVYAYVCICAWKIGRLIPNIISHQLYHLPPHSIHHRLWPGYLTKASKFVSLIPLLAISTTILSTSSLSVLFKCKSHYAKLLFKLLQVLPITVKIASKDLKTVYTNTSWSWSHLLTYFCHSLFSSYPAFLMFH